MKKILVLLLGLLFIASNVYAKTAFIAATALTGGGTGALDAIECEDIRGDDTDRAIATGDVCLVVDSDMDWYVYRYNATGTDSENSPDIIVPDDRADCSSQGQWELLDSITTARSATPQEIYGDSDCTDDDDNVYFTYDCTDTGSGTEDCDIKAYIQIAGTPTLVFEIDADGDTYFALDLDLASGSTYKINGTQIALANLSDGAAIPPANLSNQYAYELIPVSWFVDGATAPDALDDASTRSPYKYRTFDGTTQDEDIDAVWQIPNDLDVSVDVNFRLHLLVTAGTGPSTEGVVFQVQGVSIGDNDPTNPTQGAAVVSSKTGFSAAQWDYVVTDWSTDWTITDAAAGELAELNLYRDYDHASDTYGQLVGLLFMEVRYYRNPQ